MSELTGIVYAEFDSEEELKQFDAYFDFDTRPRFVEDAPAIQAKLVERAEYIEYAREVKLASRLSKFYFYWFDSDPVETLTVISELGSFFNAKKLFAYVQNDEEYQEYFRLQNDQVNTAYIVNEDDFSSHDAELEKQLESCEFDERALKYITEKFS